MAARSIIDCGGATAADIASTVETSRITSRHQAIIPADVRVALELRAGDSLAWEVRNGEVKVRKARPLDLAFAAAVSETLDEWDDATDEEAWRDL